MKRLLVVKMGDIGDAVLATPALRALRQSWPSVEIDLLCSPAGASALEGLPYISNLIVTNKRSLDHPSGILSPFNIVSIFGLATRLRSRDYDATLIFHHLLTQWGSLKYRWLARAAGAKRTVGLGAKDAEFLSDRVEDAGFGLQHESEYWLAEVRALGGKTELPLSPEIHISEADHEWADGLLPAGGETVVAFHTGSGEYSPARRWSCESFAEVADRLAQHDGVRLLVVGSAQETDVNRRFKERLSGPVIDMTGLTTVKTLASTLARCALFIGNDGGVAHIASAVGTPTLTIFGPSNAAAWSPVGSQRWEPGATMPATDGVRGLYLELGLPCQPCLYRRYSLGSREGCPSRECLGLIKSSDVLQAARHLLQRTRSEDSTDDERQAHHDDTYGQR